MASKKIGRFRSRKWQDGFIAHLKFHKAELLGENEDVATFFLVTRLIGQILAPIYFFIMFWWILGLGFVKLALLHLIICIFKFIRFKKCSRFWKTIKAADRAGLRKMRGRGVRP